MSLTNRRGFRSTRCRSGLEDLTGSSVVRSSTIRHRLGKSSSNRTKIWLSAPVQEKIDCRRRHDEEIGLVAGEQLTTPYERG